MMTDMTMDNFLAVLSSSEPVPEAAERADMWQQ